MENEADAFGDEVAALFFTGRPIEIKNECPAAVSVYLETDEPGSVMRDFRGFIDVAPQSSILARGRSVSKFFKFYARSEPYDGRRRVWRGATMADKRIIDGKAYGLKQIALTNQSRSRGPFLLKLSCS